MRKSTVALLISVGLLGAALVVHRLAVQRDTRSKRSEWSKWSENLGKPAALATFVATLVATVVQMHAAGFGPGRAALGAAYAALVFSLTRFILFVGYFGPQCVGGVEAALVALLLVLSIGAGIGGSGYLGYTSAAALGSPQWASGIASVLAAGLYVRYVLNPENRFGGLAFKVVQPLVLPRRETGPDPPDPPRRFTPTPAPR